jgi:hypothetical protein
VAEHNAVVLSAMPDVVPATEDNPAEPFWEKRGYDFLELTSNIIGLVSARVWKWLERQNDRLFPKTSKYWTKWICLPESEAALPLILIYFNRLNGIIPADFR